MNVKLKLLALISLFFFCGAMNSAAQEQNITIHVKNGSLKEILNAIEKQTTYRFSYRNVVVDSFKNISVSKTDATVSAVLDEVLAERNLIYKIVSPKSIVILDRQPPENREKRSDKKYSGTVIDEKGEAIIGVSISVKGTSIGTTSDVDRNYSITAPNEKAVVVFSYLGYISQEITVNNQRVIDVTLQEDVQMLDEIVVVGYGSMKRSDLTGSVASVNPSDIVSMDILKDASATEHKLQTA
jgi:hypothetical protein